MPEAFLIGNEADISAVSWEITKKSVALPHFWEFHPLTRGVGGTYNEVH